MTLRAKLEYIVADYAISECEWFDLEEGSTIPKEKVHDMPQTAGDSSKRSLRSTIKANCCFKCRNI